MYEYSNGNYNVYQTCYTLLGSTWGKGQMRLLLLSYYTPIDKAIVAWRLRPPPFVPSPSIKCNQIHRINKKVITETQSLVRYAPPHVIGGGTADISLAFPLMNIVFRGW